MVQACALALFLAAGGSGAKLAAQKPWACQALNGIMRAPHGYYRTPSMLYGRFQHEL
jgi:hypothetical protein